MMCGFCHDDTKVIDTRQHPNGKVVRIRECKNPDCRERTTTYELSQIQMAEALNGVFPRSLSKAISEGLAIPFPEQDEQPTLFDFFQFKFSDDEEKEDDLFFDEDDLI